MILKMNAKKEYEFKNSIYVLFIIDNFYAIVYKQYFKFVFCFCSFFIRIYDFMGTVELV